MIAIVNITFIDEFTLINSTIFCHNQIMRKVVEKLECTKACQFIQRYNVLVCTTACILPSESSPPFPICYHHKMCYTTADATHLMSPPNELHQIWLSICGSKSPELFARP